MDSIRKRIGLKIALITGITGQDGSYLAEHLLAEGYRVCGLVRRSSTLNFSRIKHIIDDIELLNADLLDQSSPMMAMEHARPDEIYNLAAQSFVPASWDQPVLTGEFTAFGVMRTVLGWSPKVTFEGLVAMIVEHDLREAARRNEE